MAKVRSSYCVTSIAASHAALRLDIAVHPDHLPHCAVLVVHNCCAVRLAVNVGSFFHRDHTVRAVLHYLRAVCHAVYVGGFLPEDQPNTKRAYHVPGRSQRALALPCHPHNG